MAFYQIRGQININLYSPPGISLYHYMLYKNQVSLRTIQHFIDTEQKIKEILNPSTWLGDVNSLERLGIEAQPNPLKLLSNNPNIKSLKVSSRLIRGFNH